MEAQSEERQAVERHLQGRGRVSKSTSTLRKATRCSLARPQPVDGAEGGGRSVTRNLRRGENETGGNPPSPLQRSPFADSTAHPSLSEARKLRYTIQWKTFGRR